MDLSINNVKANLRGLVCAFLGLFQFILLAIPYAAVYMSYGSQSQSEGISGYGVLADDMGGADAGFLATIFQILAFICGIVLLLSAAYLLVKAFFGVEMPEAFGPVSVTKVRDFALMGYAGTNVLLFVSLIIICLANSEEMFGMEMGVSLGFGIFLAVILSVGAFVALMVLEKKMPQLFEAGAPAPQYVCEQCGASAKKSAAFCSKCGGKVVAKIEEAPAAPAAAAFCPQCGTALKEGAAFCTNCGNKVG